MSSRSTDSDVEVRSQQSSCVCFVAVHRLLGTHGELTLHISYPVHFKLCAFSTVAVSVLWIFNFFVNISTETSDDPHGTCELNNEQLKQNSIVLFAYFVCFAVVRIFIFFPGVAAHVAEIQIGNLGFWRMYGLHFLLHGPLYIFGIGSVLFGLQFAMSPECQDGGETENFHKNLGWFACYSIIVFICCLTFAYAHGRLITASARYEHEVQRRAPPGTLEKLLAFTFSEDCAALFKEDGGRYSEQCPICLMDWEDGDQIKVTTCEHAFHEDCLGEWLRQDRTCALCRQDILTCRGRSAPRLSVQTCTTPLATVAQEEHTSLNMEEATAAGNVIRDPTIHVIKASRHWVPQRLRPKLQDTEALPWVDISMLPPIKASALAELDDAIDIPIRLEGNASRIKGRKLLIDQSVLAGTTCEGDLAFRSLKPVTHRVLQRGLESQMDELISNDHEGISNDQ